MADLEAFEQAVDDFRQSSFTLNGAIGALDPADHTLRGRAGETARDVFGFCHSFRRLYEEAHADLRKDLELASAEFALRPREEAGSEEWGAHVESWSNLTQARDLERARA